MNTTSGSCNLTMETHTNESDWLSNITGNNMTYGGGGRGSGIPMIKLSLPLSLMCAVRIALGCMSAILNYFLFRGLEGISLLRLKSKNFLQINAIANMVLPFSSGINNRAFAEIFGKVSDNVALCFEATTMQIYGFALFAQSVCSLLLACDRCYAITWPLKYYMVGYNKGVRVILIVSPALVGLLIYAAYTGFSLTLQLPIPSGFTPVCVIIRRAQQLQLASNVFENVLIVCHCMSFLLYAIGFLGLHIQRRQFGSAFSAQVKRENISLAISYLLKNLCSLLLYIPAPIFSYSYKNEVGKLGIQYIFMIQNCFVTLYMVNSVMAPIILIHRIPSIRNNLPFDLGFGCDNQTEVSKQTSRQAECIVNM